MIKFLNEKEHGVSLSELVAQFPDCDNCLGNHTDAGTGCFVTFESGYPIIADDVFAALCYVPHKGKIHRMWISIYNDEWFEVVRN